MTSIERGHANSVTCRPFVPLMRWRVIGRHDDKDLVQFVCLVSMLVLVAFRESSAVCVLSRRRRPSKYRSFGWPVCVVDFETVR